MKPFEQAVYANSRSSALLIALNAMAVNTYVCGTRSCVDILQGIFVKMGWQTLGVVMILFVFAPNILVVLYKTMCGRSLHAHECAIFKQNERYGLDTYSPYFQVRSNEQHARLGMSDICFEQDLQSYKEAEKDTTLRNRHYISHNEVKMV
jgi:hypothetical protein